MKRLGVILAIIIVAGATGWGANFYYNNLRGIAPVIKPPPKDISKTLPESPKAAENMTDYPLTLPDGFRMSVYAKNLTNPRVLTWDPTGVLLVSVSSDGKVLALPDSNGDGVADATDVVVAGLFKPHGIAFHDGKLFVAETHAVSVYEYDSKTRTAFNRKQIVSLPKGGNHVTRSIGFGPDNKLYITVGSSCNVCIEKESHRAAMLVANADGSGLRIFASGLRNTVFFVWNPKTGEIWGTDMGRDRIGDDIPPEEVNIIKDGGFYGWPYCYDANIVDKTFDNSKKAAEMCSSAIPPQITYQAHSAPLGLAFVPDSWPEEYRNNLLVAMHGSWNRSVPTGYKIVRFVLDQNGKNVWSKDFINGWLGNATSHEGALGRPVDLLFDANGILYVSDDKAGIIYRISRM